MRLVTLSSLLLVFAACPAAQTPEGPHFLFSKDVASLDNPFPDARFVDGGVTTLRANFYQQLLAQKAMTGKARVFFNATGQAVNANATDFGGMGGVLLRPSEALDPGSLAGHFARLVRTDSGWAVLEAQVKVEHVAQVLADQGVDAGTTVLPEYVFVRPSRPLPEDTDGLLVVTKGPTTAAGTALTRGAEWSAQAPALAPIAAALQVSEADVLLALPQRGANGSTLFKALASWADTHPAAATIPAKAMVSDNGDSRPVGAWRSTDTDWDTMKHWLGASATHVGTVVVGEFAAHDLRENDVIRADWAASPSDSPLVPLRFVLALPSGPRPQEGWTVVLAQHGVGGRNTPVMSSTESFCLNWAEELAARGMGCLGIDAPSHGSRGNFTHYFSVENLPALRDRFREMTFDLLQVERSVLSLDVDGDAQGDVAPQVRYFGNSLGAIMGANFVPFANHTSSAVLNVPGAGLSNLIISPQLIDLIGLLIVAQSDLAYGSPEYYAAFPLFRAAAQPIFEAADPITYASQVPKTRAVFVQEGLGDQTIPNDTTEDLANAMGLARPDGAVSGAAPLQVISHIDPTKYFSTAQLMGQDPHDIMYFVPTAHEQVLTFLQSDGRQLTAP
jgi:hypothetical protein